jgi:hypothetical protein
MQSAAKRQADILSNLSAVKCHTLSTDRNIIFPGKPSYVVPTFQRTPRDSQVSVSECAENRVRFDDRSPRKSHGKACGLHLDGTWFASRPRHATLNFLSSVQLDKLRISSSKYAKASTFHILRNSQFSHLSISLGGVSHRVMK